METSPSHRIEDVPLDFAEFLSRRHGVEPGKALSMLGSFLVTYEPLGTARAPLERMQRPAAFHP